jgi:hypothetical protein
MVKARDDDLKFEAEARKHRMAEIELRLYQTESGQRFLRRVDEIGRPRPLHPEDEEEGR